MTLHEQDLRHLAKSTLYAEDASVNGHSSVWGSFYDRESGAWGYACCSSISRNQWCPWGIASTSADEAVAQQLVLPGAGESLDELALAASEIQVGAEFVRRFVDAVLKEWQETGASDRRQSDTAPPKSSLKPMVGKMLAMEFEADVQEKLETACRLSLSGDHMKAQETYIALTIGNATWVMGGMEYTNENARASSFGANAKTRKIKETVSLLDDSVLKVALQSFKRLLSYMEGRAVSQCAK